MLTTLLGGGTVVAPAGSQAQLPLLLNMLVTASSVKTGAGTVGTVATGTDTLVITKAGAGTVGTVATGERNDKIVAVAGRGTVGLTTAQTFGGTLNAIPDIYVEIDITNDPTNTTRTWTDITAYVRQIGWRRSGRNHELQRSEAGTLTMVLDNRDGRFDPTNTSGDYYPGFKRLRWVRVRARWLQQYYPRWQGVIETIRQEWPGAGTDAVTHVGCVDAYKILALTDLHESEFDAATSGERVSAVLTLASVEEGTVDTGQSTLVAANGGEDPDHPGIFLPLPVNTMALEHLLAVEETENGLLVADPDGTMSFQDRHYRVRLQDASTGTIGDLAGEIPYRAAGLSVDDGDLWNEAAVTPSGGTPETASDTTSVDAYFARRLNRTILSDSQNEAKAAAEYIVYRYADPPPRLPVVQLVGRADPTVWDDILALNLSDRLLWRRRPEQAARTIEQPVHVEQIAETVLPGSDWVVEVQLSPADREAAWILDTDELEASDAVLSY